MIFNYIISQLSQNYYYNKKISTDKNQCFVAEV